MRRLAGLGLPEIRLLLRRPLPASLAAQLPPGLRIVQGALEDPASWRDELRGAGTVLHLAAATGKASRRMHLAVNLDGTRRLIESAESAGVQRLLFVSSIAVCFTERPHYHYAESKAAAEALVRTAGMDSLIVRPTVVLGPRSPLLASLTRLALLPRPVLFGGGDPLVQPIHVDDLAAMLAAALTLESWERRTISAGGPERLSIAELMRRIRLSHARAATSFVHLPILPLRGILAALEPLLLPLLPFTAGQLAFFANASLAEPDPFLARLPAPTLDVAAMLTAPRAA